MNHLMIDLETLSFQPNSTILTVAAQAFDPFTVDLGASYYARVDLEGQENRHIAESTLQWWESQPEAAAEAFALEDRHPIREVLDTLYKMIWQSEFVWSKGAFDFVILEDAYREHDIALPWKYWNVRDARTVLSLWPDCPRPTVSHHALDDCRNQIAQVQGVMKHLGITQIR